MVEGAAKPRPDLAASEPAPPHARRSIWHQAGVGAAVVAVLAIAAAVEHVGLEERPEKPAEASRIIKVQGRWYALME
jgi:hypothetical protein